MSAPGGWSAPLHANNPIETDLADGYQLTAGSPDTIGNQPVPSSLVEFEVQSPTGSLAALPPWLS
jgi:hypothetical protein